MIPGDIGYAPPEQRYGWQYAPGFNSRYLSDLYLMGSLVFFYFGKCSATQAIHLKISQSHNKDFTNSDFLQDLPYIQHAFAEVLAELRTSIRDFAGNSTDEIIMITRQLCEPDPRRRGDPRIVGSMMPQHDLQSYISRFDRLARRAELHLI
jgi:hypothetical protein